MKVLDTLIPRICQEYHLGGEANLAFFEERKIVDTPFCKSGADDFTVFLINHDLGFDVVLLLFG